MTKKKVLVTGSIGFIFSNFIRKALYEKHPYTFASVDKIARKQYLNSVYANKNHQFYIGDITDEHFMECVFELEQPEIVVHGAAETAVDHSITDPYKFITANVMGTQVIANVCRKFGVERLVYISTDEVYGQLKSETDPSWTEESPLSPRNPYSASKAAGEMIVKAAYETHGLKYNITRSSNNYGPRQTPEKLIPKVIKSILANEPITVYGKGLQVRDWTHVFDNCAGLLTVLSSGVENETYNISANQEFTNLEVIYEICKAMGKGTELITFVPDRLGHDFRYSIDSSKLKSLGWAPGIKFKTGIRQAVEWYLDNKYFLSL